MFKVFFTTFVFKSRRDIVFSFLQFLLPSFFLELKSNIEKVFRFLLRLCNHFFTENNTKNCEFDFCVSIGWSVFFLINYSATITFFVISFFLVDEHNKLIRKFGVNKMKKNWINGELKVVNEWIKGEENAIFATKKTWLRKRIQWLFKDRNIFMIRYYQNRKYKEKVKRRSWKIN